MKNLGEPGWHKEWVVTSSELRSPEEVHLGVSHKFTDKELAAHDAAIRADERAKIQRESWPEWRLCFERVASSPQSGPQIPVEHIRDALVYIVELEGKND